MIEQDGTRLEYEDDYGDPLTVVVECEGEDRVWLESEADQLAFTEEAALALASDLTAAIQRDAIDTPSHPSDLSDPRRAWNAHVFELAAQFGRLVIFDYQKEHSTGIERRKLRPETVVDGVATGHDLARSDIRAFRLDRVQGWAKVG